MTGISRREFAVGGAAMVGGFMLNANVSANARAAALAEEKSLRDKRLIRLGLNALARAPEMKYFADGHRGASLISAHMMCVDNKFDDVAAGRIVELFDRNWAPSKLCKPFPEGDRVENAVEQVGKALAEARGELREVGHDAIFAMHAIKGFRILPETATKERVEGVCQLIRAIKPWRNMKPDESIVLPPLTDEVAASRFVLKEASAAIDRFAGFGQGFAGHMLTFGQSLIEMAAMGEVEWANSCRTAFLKYVTVTRVGPQKGDRKIKDHAVTKLRPNNAEYWQKRGDKTLGLGHVFKYPYAYYDLLARAKDVELQKELEAKAWQIF